MVYEIFCASLGTEFDIFGVESDRFVNSTTVHLHFAINTPKSLFWGSYESMHHIFTLKIQSINSIFKNVYLFSFYRNYIICSVGLRADRPTLIIWEMLGYIMGKTSCISIGWFTVIFFAVLLKIKKNDFKLFAKI